MSSESDSTTGSNSSNRRARIISGHTDEPPLYSIDLSKPPRSRYEEICNDYKDEMAELVTIYDDLLSFTPSPRFFAFLAKNLLRKVSSKEETEEIKGISKAARIPLHLVVAYNTFLDLFSGCMSGGVQAKVPRARGTRMLHFRNLDWNMEPLRDMIIRVQYLLGGKVVARAVTYAGYVGVLTGVRKGLSMSMNYRARIQSTSSTLKNRIHHLLLLLGHRQSIASELRQILLSPGGVPTLDELANRFSQSRVSSCYLTFCTPSSVLVVEKDLTSAITQTSNDFLAVTNHDLAMEAWTPEQWRHLLESGLVPDLGGAREIVEESVERKECLCNLWRDKGVEKTSVSDVKDWLRRYPIRNECTHFSCIMDPSVQGGGLLWVETCEAD
ncbi:hypothetical protein GALMADRAFT_254613 [Galerina marginata CBS 339.88]|uniref:ceramidase n=1 Tax=Galerina marginata (strain CBS 339.88) TaxID=685588 RepID=A0A067SJD8_GALM3|nr:hypothetical protein GALMADRAFT_254613 [Galerina marginata CBS 339.88]